MDTRSKNLVTNRNRSFRQRVSSPTTSPQTYQVDSQTSNVRSPTPLNCRIEGHFYPYLHINYSPFCNPLRSQTKPLNMCTQNFITPHRFILLVLSFTRHTILYSSFFYPLPSQTKEYFGHWVRTGMY